MVKVKNMQNDAEARLTLARALLGARSLLSTLLEKMQKQMML